MNESQCEQRSDTMVRTRRTFLKHSSVLIAGAAGAQSFLPSNASAQDARVAQDIAVLNYALTLERLEADFYITGLQRFGAADFATFGQDAVPRHRQAYVIGSMDLAPERRRTNNTEELRQRRDEQRKAWNAEQERSRQIRTVREKQRDFHSATEKKTENTR